MQANSRPMTPPPTTIRRAGTSAMSSASVLVITPGRSRPGIGGRAVIDPGARITWLADTLIASPVSGCTRRVSAPRASPSAQQGDTRPLQQVLDPADQRVHGSLLVLHEGGQVGRGRRDRDAELVGTPRLKQQLGRRGQGLGRDAADVQAGAPHPLVLDEHRARAELRCSKRSHVPARTPTEHGEVELAGQDSRRWSEAGDDRRRDMLRGIRLASTFITVGSVTL